MPEVKAGWSFCRRLSLRSFGGGAESRGRLRDRSDVAPLFVREGVCMNEPQPVAVENFSHVCIGVSDMEKSLAFYTAVLGMDIVFDVELAGAGLDAVTGGAAQNGRMVGGLIGGAMVELLFLGDVPVGPAGPRIGYTNMSFRVADLDDTFETLRQQHPDVRTDA